MPPPALLPVAPTLVGRGRNLSLDYLRTTLTLVVVACHSAEAYTSWAYFDAAQPLRSTAPVVDAARWLGFDSPLQFADSFLMSLLFFISGLFVYPALQRQGAWGFARERLWRLGVPFALAMAVLMPLAYYASWQLSGRHQGFWLPYRQGYLVGPAWFIWLLLLFDLLAAALRPLLGWLLPVAGRWLPLGRAPGLAAAVLAGLVLAAYWPLVARYGPDSWTVLGSAPFAYQAARLGVYAVWFGAGLVVGAPGLAAAGLTPAGRLARRWPAWLATSLLLYLALRGWPRWAPGAGFSLAAQRGGSVGLWAASCVASCLAGLAFFGSWRPQPHPWLPSLTRSAYVIYLVHYPYMTWLQLLLVPLAWPAVLKFGLVFSATTGLSWLTALGVLRVPLLRRLL